MLPSRWILVLALALASACGDDSPSPSADDDSSDDGSPKADAGKTNMRDASTSNMRDGGGDPNSSRDAAAASDAAVLKDAGGSVVKDAGSVDAGGTTTSPPGNATAKTVSVGGVSRTYQLYIPKSLTNKTAGVPFVGVFHGFTMTGTVMENLTTWKAIAEREKFVVVFPDGGGSSPWNVGQGVCNVGQAVSAPETQDDFGFIRAMVDETKKDQAINEAQIFVGGFSMGGYFANNVACKMSDYVRATSAHSGGTYDGTCTGKRIPMLLIHGDADGLIPYACGQQARDLWVSRNKCATTTTKQTIKMGSCEWNEGCPAGQEVGMCTLNGMDHGWAGARYTGSWWMLQYGGGEQYENAAEMMWTFFKKYL